MKKIMLMLLLASCGRTNEITNVVHICTTMYWSDIRPYISDGQEQSLVCKDNKEVLGNVRKVAQGNTYVWVNGSGHGEFSTWEAAKDHLRNIFIYVKLENTGMENVKIKDVNIDDGSGEPISNSSTVKNVSCYCVEKPDGTEYGVNGCIITPLKDGSKICMSQKETDEFLKKVH